MNHMFTWDGDALNIRTDTVKEPSRLLFLSDMHFSPNDERGIPFQQYSGRMENCYKRYDMTPLKTILDKAETDKTDSVFMLGDMINFPTEAGVEKLSALMKGCAVPVHYICGNHDWHYEGLPDSEHDLRKEWTAKRLMPLFGKKDPLGYSVVINGVKILMMDDSNCEITQEQLIFAQKEIAECLPTILACHIPLYVPGHDIFFSCGNPFWGTATDPYWEIERRERWAEHQSDFAMYFRDMFFERPNVLGIVAGHIHKFSLDHLNGKFQLVLPFDKPVPLNVIPW